MADDTCWDFVSSQMVPLAMAGSLHSNSQLAAIADPRDVINTFISVLAHNLAEIPKNEVCICSMHNNSTPYIFSYSALSFIIFHHILAAQGHCCRHFNKVPPQSVHSCASSESDGFVVNNGWRTKCSQSGSSVEC